MPRISLTDAQPADPPYKQNQFGFALGGPIVRNRTFFFADYEGLRVRQAQTITSFVPTDAQRAGDFSDQLDLTQRTGTDCSGHPTFVGESSTPETPETDAEWPFGFLTALECR